MSPVLVIQGELPQSGGLGRSPVLGVWVEEPHFSGWRQEPSSGVEEPGSGCLERSQLWGSGKSPFLMVQGEEPCLVVLERRAPF